MRKNAFYFTSKVLFVLKIFKFLSWSFGHVSKRLDWAIVIHILPNISRSKGNQTIKFGLLIYCNMKSYTKCGWLVSDAFPNNLDWAYLWINSLKFYAVSFCCMETWGISKYIETKLQTTCFTSYQDFPKNKKRSGTSRPASFSA